MRRVLCILVCVFALFIGGCATQPPRKVRSYESITSAALIVLIEANLVREHYQLEVREHLNGKITAFSSETARTAFGFVYRYDRWLLTVTIAPAPVAAALLQVAVQTPAHPPFPALEVYAHVDAQQKGVLWDSEWESRGEFAADRREALRLLTILDDAVLKAGGKIQ